MEMFSGIVAAAIVSGSLITAATIISLAINDVAKAIREQKNKK